MSENGVQLALAAAKKAEPDRSPYQSICDLLNKTGDVLTLPAIYNFEKKGYFPPERARIIAEAFDIPVHKLVNPRFGSLLDAR